MNYLGKIVLSGLALFGLAACYDSNQQPDPDFIPKNSKNSFATSKSPIVFVDEAHSNFQTIDTRLKAFAQVLTSDGYTVKPGKEKFTLGYLQQADILVIANARDKDRQQWTPPFGVAFTTEEVAAVKQWVSQGGALFLVVDHKPFPKIAKKLTDAFGFEFNNGHVNNATFNLANNGLPSHPITNGSAYAERIVQVRSFGGAAFKIPPSAKPLLRLGIGTFSSMPELPFQVNPQTPRISMEGWYQGAVMTVGKGRIAVFAEATMFTSQVILPSGNKLGLVSPGAEQNEPFLLNVMHWLSNTL